VKRVNVFDQGRISYLRREIIKHSPKLEDNLQILKLEVRKSPADLVQVEYDAHHLQHAEKSNQTRPSGGEHSDRENPLLSSSSSRESANMEAPDNIHTQRIGVDEGIRRSKMSPEMPSGFTRNSPRRSSVGKKKGGTYQSVSKTVAGKASTGTEIAADPGGAMLRTGKFDPSAFENSLDDVNTIKRSQRSEKPFLQFASPSKRNTDLGEASLQSRKHSDGTSHSRKPTLIQTQTGITGETAEQAISTVKHGGPFVFGGKLQNSKILVAGIPSGEPTTSKEPTVQNSSRARIAVINKRGHSGQNKTARNGSHDGSPGSTRQSPDKESIFDQDQGEKPLENKMSNLESVFQQNSLNNTTTQGNSSPELVKKNLQVDQIRLKSKKMNQESILEEPGDQHALKSHGHDQEI
jgi:hypothetical protein